MMRKWIFNDGKPPPQFFHLSLPRPLPAKKMSKSMNKNEKRFRLVRALTFTRNVPKIDVSTHFWKSFSCENSSKSSIQKFLSRISATAFFDW